MAFGTRGAGVTTRSNPLVEYLPLSNINIAKGVVGTTNATGAFIVAVAGALLNSAFFVTVEAVDNSSGAAGDLAVGSVGAGQFVTVSVSATSATINPGDHVKVGSDDGEVARFVPGTDDNNLVVGVYLRKEGGTIAKNGSTPFTEEFTDAGDYSVGTAVAGNIIEIRIGQ